MSRLISAGEPGAIDEAIAALRRGEVIAIPTETVYGVAVLPTDDGIERLIAAKHRSAEKGIQLLVDSVAQTEGIADLGAAAKRLATSFWPGGLTIVLIEHEMSVIERVTQKCVVLNYGRKIAEGSYREVASDPEVRKAYLGLE